MTDLSREIRILVSLVDKEPGQFSKFQAQIEQLKKAAAALDNMPGNSSGRAEANRNAERAIKNLLDGLDKQEKAELKAAAAAERKAQIAKQAAEAEAAALRAVQQAEERLAEVRAKGVEQAKADAKARAQGATESIRSIKELEAEISVLVKLQKQAADAGSRLDFNNALKAARSELVQAKEPFRTLEEQALRAGNAFRSIGVGLGTKDIAKQIEDLKGPLADLAGKAGLGGLSGSLSGVASAAGPAGAALATVTAGVAGLKVAADSATEYGTALETVARAGNLTDKTAAGLLLSIKRTGGDFKDAAGLASQFTSRLNEGREAGSSAQKSFERVGVSLADLRTKNADEILLKIADGLLKIGDQEARVRGASEIFGDDDAVRFLKVAESLRSVSEEAERLGLVLGPDAKREIAEYRKQIAELETQIEAFKVKVGTPAAGILANTLSFWTELFGGSNRLEQDGTAIGKQLGEGIKKGVASSGVYVSGVRANAETGTAPTRPPVAGLGAGLPDTIDSQISKLKTLNDQVDESGRKSNVYKEQLEALAETKRKIEALDNDSLNTLNALAEAMGGTVDQVYQLVRGNVELAGALLQQADKSRAAQKATEDQTAALRGLQGAASAANKAAEDSAKVETQLAAASDARLRSVQATNAAILRAGGDELENAKYLAKVQEEINQEKLAAAEATYERRLEANSRTLDSELAKVKGNAAAEKSVRETFAKEQGKIQADFDAKVLASREASEQTQLALEQAYAAKRSEVRQKEAIDRSAKTKAALSEIDALEEGSIGRHAEFARRRSDVTANGIRSEISLLQNQLKEEKVGTEERKRLTDEIAAKERELAALEISTSAQVRTAKAKDTKEVTDVKLAALDKEKAGLNAQIIEIQKSGQSEVAIAEQVGAIKQQLLELDIRKVETAIAARKEILAGQGAEADKDVELIRLETELIALRGQQGTVAKEAADAVVAAKEREKNATEGVNSALGNTGKKAKEAAEEMQKSAGGFASALAQLYNDFRSFIQRAKDATSENIDDILKEAQERFGGFNHAVLSPLEAGVYGGLRDLAGQGLQEAFKARDRLAEEAARKFAEEQQRQYEEAFRTINDVFKNAAKEEADALENRNERLADIDQRRIDEAAGYATRLTEISTDNAKRLADFDEQEKQKDIDRERQANRQKLADEQAFREQLAGLQRSAADRAFDSARDGILKASDLRTREAELTERVKTAQDELNQAQAKGDAGAIQTAQKNLADLKKQQEILAAEKEAARKQQEVEQQRQTELNDAIAKAQRGELTKEELDALVKSINEKYDLEKQYYSDRLQLIKDGNKDLLPQLDAAYAQQRNLLKTSLQTELNLIKENNRIKKQQRDEDAELERQDRESRRNDIIRDNEQRLNDEKAAHAKRLEELKKQEGEVQAEYQKTLTSIKTATAERLADLKSQYGSFFDSIISKIGDVSKAAKDALNDIGKIQPPATDSGSGTGKNTSSSGTGDDKGQGGPASVGPRNGGGSQTGPSSTSGTQDPKTTPPGGNSTNTAGANQSGSTKNSTQIINDFIAYTDTFDSSKRVQTLAQSLSALDDMLNPRQLPGEARVPIITQADYDRAKAAIKAFWTLRNVWDAFRKRQIGAGYVIHLLEEMVDAKLITQAAADPYIKFAKGRIDDFGKEHNNGIPKFDNVPGATSSVNTGPANLTTPPGPTPIPGPMPQGSDFGKPITGNYGTGQYGNPVTGNYNPGPGTSQYGNPVTGYQNLTLVQELFADIKAGKRDTSYGASAIADWFNKGKISKILYDAAYARLLRYSNGDKSALDNFTGTNIYGNQVGNYQSATVPPPAVLPQAALNLQSMVASVPSGTTFAVDGGSREYQDGRLPLQRADAPALPRLPVKQGETGAINMTFNGDFFTEETVRSIQGLAQGEVQKDIGRRNRIIRNATKGRE